MGTKRTLLVAALVVASAVLVWIMAAPRTAVSPIVPVAMISIAFLGLCFGLYRAFQRSADTAGRAFDAAMQGVAAELKLEYHPPKQSIPLDWPTASGRYRGWHVRFSIVSEAEQPMSTGVFVHVPQVSDTTLAKLKKRRIWRVRIRDVPQRSAADSELSPELEASLRALAKRVDAVELAPFGLLFTASSRTLTWDPTYGMETDIDKLQGSLDAALDVAELLSKEPS